MTLLMRRYLRRTNHSAAEQLGAAGGALDLDFSTPPPPLFAGRGPRQLARPPELPPCLRAFYMLGSWCCQSAMERAEPEPYASWGQGSP